MHSLKRLWLIIAKIARQILASLANEPDITSAYLFSAEGKAVAHYLSKQDLEENPAELIKVNREDLTRVIANQKMHFYFDQHRLSLFSPIMGKNRLNGVITLQADLSELYNFIYQFIAATFAVFLSLALIASPTRVRWWSPRPSARARSHS